MNFTKNMWRLSSKNTELIDVPSMAAFTLLDEVATILRTSFTA